MIEETLVLLESLERKLLDASVREDPIAVNRLLSDDFIVFGSSGNIYNKAEVISGFTAERDGPRIDRRIEDLSVRLLSEAVALITYTAVRNRAGEPGWGKTFRSSVWKLSSGGSLANGLPPRHRVCLVASLLSRKTGREIQAPVPQ